MHSSSFSHFRLHLAQAALRVTIKAPVSECRVEWPETLRRMFIDIYLYHCEAQLLPNAPNVFW